MSQLGWVQILYDQQLTSIGYFLSAKIAIETQQFFCPPKPRVVGSTPPDYAKFHFSIVSHSFDTREPSGEISLSFTPGKGISSQFPHPKHV